MASADNRDWTEAITTLRKLCPTIAPVIVRRARTMPDCYGDCTAEYDDRGKVELFRVRVHYDLDPPIQRHILVHEWAHAMAWSERSHHPNAWGVAYARAYRAVFE